MRSSTSRLDGVVGYHVGLILQYDVEASTSMRSQGREFEPPSGQIFFVSFSFSFPIQCLNNICSRLKIMSHLFIHYLDEVWVLSLPVLLLMFHQISFDLNRRKILTSSQLRLCAISFSVVDIFTCTPNGIFQTTKTNTKNKLGSPRSAPFPHCFDANPNM